MKKSVLLVEDDDALLTAMACFFCESGFDVETASEAEEAVAMVRHHRFSIVITDLELNSIEGLDGFAVLKALRHSRPATKVIVYSGYSDTRTVEAALGQGGTRFLSKPTPFNELLKNAEELCQRC